MKKQPSKSSRFKQSNQLFEGSNPSLKGWYYTYSPDQPAVDQYQATTEKIVEVVCQMLKESQLLKASLKSLTKQTLIEPQLEQNGFTADTPPVSTSTRQDELKYTTQFKTWEHRVNALEESLNKTFATIYGHVTVDTRGRDRRCKIK